MAFRSLFVIIDPSRDEQPALARAATLVREAGGHIHAFCCVHQDDLSGYASPDDARFQIEERAREELNRLTRGLASDKVSVEAEICWNKNWFESAVEACIRSGADLLLKSTFSHSWTSHILSKRSDHHILRHSPCPVLLTKTSSDQHYQRVLAAIAVEDNDRPHETLNNQVMTEAERICRSSGASLHAVAALEGAPNIAQVLKITEDRDEEKRAGEERLNALYGLPPENIHVDYGSAREVILEAHQGIGADLLIMGTIARAGVSGAIIGNTCEKVLDRLESDILTVS